jgi:DNA segregation ATPase FtsK/SpoIIIE, S-DNA-T family
MFTFRMMIHKCGLIRDKWGTFGNSQNLVVPIGINDCNRIQYLILGDDAANHALISGSVGKSHLLHVIITAALLAYSPEKMQLYILDLKEGSEYKSYVEHPLPHIRRVAAGVDLEEGFKIMQLVDEELLNRQELFHLHGVSDMQAYSKKELPLLPRILFVIDELQYLFEKDDYFSSNARLLVDRLVREGPDLGVHLLLSSRIFSKADSQLRETLKQITLRIAFSSDYLEAQTILAENNSAATRLSNLGEAIYNADCGAVSGNKHFQTAYISPEELSYYLDEVKAICLQRETASE